MIHISKKFSYKICIRAGWFREVVLLSVLLWEKCSSQWDKTLVKSIRCQERGWKLDKLRHSCTAQTESITLRDDLHWLPIRQRTVYKIGTIVYKRVHGTAPSYLAKTCTPAAASTGRCNLRSATHGDQLVPRTRTITYGPRSFAVSGPCVCNDLPPTLHASAGTLRQFQSTLKTILLCSAYRTRFGAFATV